jgi:hypothetical protein
MSFRRLVRVALLVLPLPALAQQQLRGSVRDSTSRLPISGAVIVAYDAQRVVVGRNITDETGAYRVMLSAAAQTVHVTRIGFRPRDIPVPAATGTVTTLDIGMTLIPTFLEQVQVLGDASGCPRRPDAARTASLIDQAKAGLLAAVVAREANPARVTRLAYERRLDANGQRIESQNVRMETADNATFAFNAAQTGVDFATRGFSGEQEGRRTFYGPDADVLLDEGFAAAYCFRIADRDPKRPTMIGLGFSPMARKDGRIDIDGALWVDTVARRLSSIEFRYRGLDPLSEALESGGEVSFHEVAPGIVLIDHWRLRVIGGLDQVPGAPRSADAAPTRVWVINELGGELATVSWPNGRAWTAPLATLTLEAKNSAGTPLRGATVGLVGTDYQAMTDSAGIATIPHLVPGPYSVTALDERLAAIGLTLPTNVAFTAVRDSSLRLTAMIPTAEEFAAGVCRASGRVVDESAWIIGRVGLGNGAPVAAAKWAVSRSTNSGWTPVVEGGATGNTGLFSYCRNLKVGETVQIKAWRQRESPAVVVRPLAQQLTVLPVRLPSVVARGRGGSATMTGTVTDSVTGATVAGAFVELVGSSLSAISDSAGKFTIENVPRGDYTAEIRTNMLDSLGAVGRSNVAFANDAPVRIYVPTARDLTSAMCGPAGVPGTGVVIGNLLAPAGGTMPAGTRVVAEWAEAAPSGSTTGTVGWVRARADAEGGFRVCGVPLGASLTLRTHLDSGATVASRPIPLQMGQGQTFAFADVQLEAGLSVPAAFSGIVVADSTDDALDGAVVTIAGVNRSVTTNAAGAFRINDVPPGMHRVSIRRPGYAPITATVGFTANQTVDHRVVLGKAMVALAAVEVSEAAPVSPTFDQNRKLGLGKFLTAEDLEKHGDRRLGDVMATVPSMGGISQASSGTAWVVGKRVPPKLTPRGMGSAEDKNMECGSGPNRQALNATTIATSGGTRSSGGGSASAPCSFDKNSLRDQGYYCPDDAGEAARGVTCACYAQVYVDGVLQNKQRPTEPFDMNTLSPRDLVGVEWYASASQVPAEYSSLNSPCGVLAVWTRRRH